MDPCVKDALFDNSLYTSSYLHAVMFKVIMQANRDVACFVPFTFQINMHDDGIDVNVAYYDINGRYQKVVFSEHLRSMLMATLHTSCKDKPCLGILFSIRHESWTIGHMFTVVVNSILQHIEIFDAYGTRHKFRGYAYNLIDDFIEELLTPLFPGFELISSDVFCPRKSATKRQLAYGPQMLMTKGTHKMYMSCALWAYWFLNERLHNPVGDAGDLIMNLMLQLDTPEDFDEFISDFFLRIVSEADLTLDARCVHAMGLKTCVDQKLIQALSYCKQQEEEEVWFDAQEHDLA